MSFIGATDIPPEIIGGLVCDTAASELPTGVSPNCQDVSFSDSSVQTRPGLGAPVVTLSGNVVNYLKTFLTSSGTLRALALTDTANLYKETSAGIFGLVTQVNDINIAAPYGNSTTIFEREYLAFSDGKYGVAMPRQFDDTNFDRVSQVGPGAPPSVADENATYNLAASPGGAEMIAPANVAAGTAGFVQLGNLVTVTASGAFPTPHVGDLVKIAGATNASYDGVFAVASVPLPNTNFTYVNPIAGLAPSGGGTVDFGLCTFTTSPANTFVVGGLVTIAGVGVGGYDGTFTIRQTLGGGTQFVCQISANGTSFGLANSGGGTASTAGNVVVGLHQVSCLFVTRQQYLTPLAPLATWTSQGGKRAIVTNIPIGPPNVIQRILCFTAAGGTSFFYVTGADATLANSNMVINDNVTTTLTVDFTDAILLAGVNVDALYNQVELGECSGVIDYKLRTFWWGERAKIPNFVNLTFDGSFSGLTSATTGTTPNYPLGWTPDPVFAPGGASALVQGQPAIWGDAYAIFGNGSTATRGLITQSAYQDFRSVPILQANTAYSVRFRACWKYTTSGSPTAGNLVLEVYSPSLGSLGLVSVPYSTLTNSYAEYNLPLLAAQTTFPSDALLRLYANGTPDQHTVFLIDNIEPYVTNQPTNASVVRASRAQQPESFDGVNGLLEINENDGYRVTSAFKLRERLYFLKEHSLFVTQDDATNEPAGWSVDEVSRTVGTPSVRGVGLGEDWVVIADRAGLYIFSGGEPQKISQEIGHANTVNVNGVATNLTLAWDQINWQYGHTIWVTVNTIEKQVVIGAPFNGATSPNAILQLDYRDIDPQAGVSGADTIAGSPPITVSFRGVKIVRDKSRKWSPWTPSINSSAMIERFDGSSQLWMGAGSGVPVADRGAIYQVSRANLTDYSTAAQIPSYYWTAFMPQRQQNQEGQTHEHRKYFNYLTMFVEGSGFLNLSAAPNQFGTFLAQQLPSLILLSPPYGELETPLDVEGERVAFKISQSGTASWFRLQKFTPSMMPAPMAPVRGTN